MIQKAQRKLGAEKAAQEAFMSKFFPMIVKPLIERQILPLIDEIVEEEFSNIEIKGKLNRNELLELLDRI